MNSQARSNQSKSNFESENNSQYNDYLQAKIEVLSKAWLEIDKSFDCEVDQRELLDFLDSRMKNRKKFDRSVAIEIFKLMDLDQNGKISVEEFIKRYISIEDEIRRDIRDYQKIFLIEKENNAKMYKLMMQHKNENLNEKGVGTNAKIILQITSIEFLKQIQGKLENISIKLKLDNQVAETSVVAFESKLFYKESFEFKVGSGENLVIEILNHGPKDKISSVGKVFFSLNSISAEDEYDLELVIPELDNLNSNLAKITGSFHFILSMFKYYRDLFNESENMLKEYESNLNKRNYFLENMNEPLKTLESKYEQVIKVKGVEELAGSQPRNNLGDNQDSSPGNIFDKFVTPTVSEIQMADKLENLIKNTLNQPNIQWMGLIKFFLILWVLLAFFNLMDRTDFVNFILPIAILVLFYTSLNNNVIRNLNFFILVIASSLAYDLIWFIFSGSIHFTGAGNSSSLKIFVMLSSLILFIVKILLGVSIWIQRLKYHRLNSNNSNDANSINRNHNQNA